MAIETPSLISVKENNKSVNVAERDEDLQTLISTPLVAKIEVTNRCNLRCVMCSVRKNERQPQDLSFNIFKKLEPIFPDLLSVYLYGIGEVLLYPKAMDMFYMLLEYNINVGFITNGQLITEELAEQWALHNMYKLSISIDSINKQKYEAIRKGASFDRLLANLLLINKVKEKYSAARPALTFNYVVMRDTINELPDLVDFAAEHKAEELIVSDLVVFYSELKRQAVSYDEVICTENFEKAEKRAKERNITLVLPAPYQYQKQRRKIPINQNESDINRCTEPWSSFWLSVDGIVSPCCYWMKPMGDLAKHDFLEIWNNQEYRYLRSTVNTENRTAHCRQCAIAGMKRRN